MTIQVKHVRAGVLLVADAALRFGPGQVLEVETVTPQLERAITLGVLVRHEDDQATGTEAAPTADATDGVGPEAAEVSEIDLSKLRAAEAISKVEAEHDPARLKAHLSNEQRRTVIAALEKRLSEVDAGDR